MLPCLFAGSVSGWSQNAETVTPRRWPAQYMSGEDSMPISSEETLGP